MKKKIFIGFGLLGIAFTGAAFTANKAKMANHYIQKPGQCVELITTTNCDTESSNECLESDGTGPWPVFETRINPAQCETPLFRPDQP